MSALNVMTVMNVIFSAQLFGSLFPLDPLPAALCLYKFLMFSSFAFNSVFSRIQCLLSECVSVCVFALIQISGLRDVPQLSDD